MSASFRFGWRLKCSPARRWRSLARFQKRTLRKFGSERGSPFPESWRSRSEQITTLSLFSKTLLNRWGQHRTATDRVVPSSFGRFEISADGNRETGAAVQNDANDWAQSRCACGTDHIRLKAG